jgi:hypothetical protein
MTIECSLPKCHWHVAPNGALVIYSSGRIALAIVLSPAQRLALARDLAASVAADPSMSNAR